MTQFTLSTDSTCDLYSDYLRANRIACAPLTFTVEKDGKMDDRLDAFESYGEYVSFYNELRAGAVSRTSMLNYGAHLSHFTRLAQNGAKDVLHFTISSGLSPTKTVARKAAEEVKKRYPEFSLYLVDPLTATVGQGALVQMALKFRNEGLSAREAHDRCNAARLHIQHFIVADDLNYLYRGGRVSAVSAAVGSLLKVKPIISFDKEGKLFVLEKVHGVKKAIAFIKKKMETEGPDERGLVYIVHTDNAAASEELAAYVRERFSVKPQVSIMGPVIGSHVGPNAFALGYISKSERNEF